MSRVAPISGAFLLGMVCFWLLQTVSRMDIRHVLPQKQIVTDPGVQATCVGQGAEQDCMCPKGVTHANGQVMRCLIVTPLGTLVYSDERAYDGGVGLNILDQNGAVQATFGLGGGDPFMQAKPARPPQFATKVSTIKKLSETSYLVQLTNPNLLEAQGLEGLKYERFVRVSFSPLQLEPLTDRDLIGLGSAEDENEYVFDTGTDRANPTFVLSRLHLPGELQSATSTLEVVSDLTRQLRKVGFISQVLRLPSMGLSVRAENAQGTLLQLEHFYIGYGGFSEKYLIDITSPTEPSVKKLPNPSVAP